jgi:hypothetical protein
VWLRHAHPIRPLSRERRHRDMILQLEAGDRSGLEKAIGHGRLRSVGFKVSQDERFAGDTTLESVPTPGFRAQKRQKASKMLAKEAIKR